MLDGVIVKAPSKLADSASSLETLECRCNSIAGAEIGKMRRSKDPPPAVATNTVKGLAVCGCGLLLHRLLDTKRHHYLCHAKDFFGGEVGLIRLLLIAWK